jgi:hypothetical protein
LERIREKFEEDKKLVHHTLLGLLDELIRLEGELIDRSSYWSNLSTSENLPDLPDNTLSAVRAFYEILYEVVKIRKTLEESLENVENFLK